MLVSCETLAAEPGSPILEFNGESCSVDYGENNYKVSITHILQGITSITFSQPEDLSNVVYTFSGNGCEITYDDLTFKTDISFMEKTALPQVINEVLTDAQKEGALTYTGSDSPEASTLTTAVFSGKSDHFYYEIVTDFDSGYIKEIDIPDCDTVIKFAAK